MLKASISHPHVPRFSPPPGPPCRPLTHRHTVRLRKYSIHVRDKRQGGVNVNEGLSVSHARRPTFASVCKRKWWKDHPATLQHPGFTVPCTVTPLYYLINYITVGLTNYFPERRWHDGARTRHACGLFAERFIQSRSPQSSGGSVAAGTGAGAGLRAGTRMAELSRRGAKRRASARSPRVEGARRSRCAAAAAIHTRLGQNQSKPPSPHPSPAPASG